MLREAPLYESTTVDVSDGPPVGLRALQATAGNLRRYHAAIGARSAATFGVMLLCYFGYVSVWILVLANLLLYPPVYLRIHDIGHATSSAGFGWIARFVPVSNPIWGGTRVFIEMHKDHHIYLGTNKDPWLPYYTGHPLRALFFNFIEPEYSFCAFVRRRGFDRELAANVAFNATCLVFGLVVFQWLYVVHVLSQRVFHMVGIYFFNFYTHRASFSADAPIGTWDREEGMGRLLPVLRGIWGRGIDGLAYHNRHHCLGQMHVPVENYRYLTDTGRYTRFCDGWPIAEVQQL